MRRRFAALLTAVFFGTVLTALSPAHPAKAQYHVCAGTGTASTSWPGLFYPSGTTTTTSGLGGGSLTFYALPRLLAFAFTTTGGAFVCVPGDGYNSASGLVSGWCGHAWGVGTTNHGGRFAWVDVGSKMILTGMLVGAASFQPDTLAAQSCETGALQFFIAGTAATMQTCNIFKNKFESSIITVPDPLFHTLTTLPTIIGWTTYHLTIAGGNYRVWYKLCVPSP